MKFYMSTGQSELVRWTELGRELCVKKKYCVRDVEMSRVVVGGGSRGVRAGGRGGVRVCGAPPRCEDSPQRDVVTAGERASRHFFFPPSASELARTPRTHKTLPRILQVVSFSVTRLFNSFTTSLVNVVL